MALVDGVAAGGARGWWLAQHKHNALAGQGRGSCCRLYLDPQGARCAVLHRTPATLMCHYPVCGVEAALGGIYVVPPNTIVGVGPPGEESERWHLCVWAQVCGQVSLIVWMWVGSSTKHRSLWLTWSMFLSLCEDNLYYQHVVWCRQSRVYWKVSGQCQGCR